MMPKFIYLVTETDPVAASCPAEHFHANEFRQSNSPLATQREEWPRRTTRVTDSIEKPTEPWSVPAGEPLTDEWTAIQLLHTRAYCGSFVFSPSSITPPALHFHSRRIRIPIGVLGFQELTSNRRTLKMYLTLNSCFFPKPSLNN